MTVHLSAGAHLMNLSFQTRSRRRMEKPPSVLVPPFIISLEPRAVQHRPEDSQRAGRSRGWRRREEGRKMRQRRRRRSGSCSITTQPLRRCCRCLQMCQIGLFFFRVCFGFCFFFLQKGVRVGVFFQGQSTICSIPKAARSFGEGRRLVVSEWGEKKREGRLFATEGNPDVIRLGAKCQIFK